ncbi:hypothetical protein JT116_02390, partial [Helicobacter pylori]|nr:hypothetical protein [Helicobacter pylori]
EMFFNLAFYLISLLTIFRCFIFLLLFSFLLFLVVLVWGLLFYCFIVLLFYCFIVLLFYCFIVLFFEKKERAGYKPYKRGQKIKIANHINIDQN